MKPVVIESDEKGIAKITVKYIQELLDEAYNAGYADGKKEATPLWYQPHSVPTVGTTEVPWWFGKYDVTCSSDDLSFSSMAEQCEE